LLRFKSSQKVFQIGKVKIGGQPGENPKVMIGTIFYEKHKIMIDEKKGDFDKKAAEDLINKQDELCEETGLQSMLDVVCISIDGIPKILDFVTKVTDSPILYDAWRLDTKLAGLKYIEETGLSNRIVYNSIMPLPPPKKEEMDAIKAAKLKSSIVLAYNAKDRSVNGVISILKGTDKEKGLLRVAEEAGVTMPLIDVTLFTYIPSIGMGCKAIYAVKDELGLPAGGSPGNATTTWKMPKEKWGLDVFKACEASAQVVSLAFGGDYILYGTIESAPWIIPSCAAIDAMAATVANFEYKMPLSDTHPLNKMFPDFVQKLKKAATAI
jgi:tetrahydromethanopterin S-methyltransferase subunit H